MPRPQFEHAPVTQIGDQHTRTAIDRLQRAMAFAFSENGLATMDDLDALKRLIGSNATQAATPSTTKKVTQEVDNSTGKYVRLTGDVMSGGLYIYTNTVSNITTEAHGINQVKRTSHDQSVRYSNFTTYELYDIVVEGGKIWQSLQAANLGNDPTLTTGYWTQVALQASPYVLENWSVATAYDPPTYPVGSQVLHSGRAWASRVNAASNLAIEPGVTAGYANFWTEIPYHVAVGPNYAVDDMVVWGIGLYKCLVANNGFVPHANPTKWESFVPVGVGMQCNSFGTNSDGFGVTFGIACEAWNGYYPRPDEYGVPTRADRRLIGIEPSVINRNPYGYAAKVGVDVTFKNRADVEYATAMPLGRPNVLTIAGGENRYNIHARAIQISSFPRSSTGEYCGWPTVMKVDHNSTDISEDQPFTVLVDMYDQSQGNDGSDTWWKWWASGLGATVLQPLGWESGIRYNSSNNMLEFHANIVDGTKLVATIDMTNYNPTHIMCMNSGNFPMRVGMEESFDMVSVGWNSGTNFVTAGATGAAANPFTVPANVYPVGFWSFWIDGAHKKFAWYNP